MRRINNGFTLIELLVVITITAVIMSIATVSYSTAQKQARDAKRQRDLQEIQSTLEQEYAISSSYPTTATGVFQGNSFPTDPKNSGAYTYNWTYLTATGYCICALFESKLGNSTIPNGGTCNWNNAGSYYCIQNQQ